MFDSDAELMSYVRGQVGVNRDGDLPEQALKTELERGKSEINKEVRERLNNSDSLDFYNSDAPQRALEYFVQLRARVVVIGNQKARKPSSGLPDVSNAPSSILSMRRHDFGDQTMNHWRDRMVTHLNRVTE